jgi:hypothetical protein
MLEGNRSKAAVGVHHPRRVPSERGCFQAAERIPLAGGHNSDRKGAIATGTIEEPTANAFDLWLLV